jgi:RNA polymerase sigma-70 factor (ECF subfamily)
MKQPEKIGVEDPGKDFNALYEAYSPAIYKFGFRILGNHEEANDLAQETFFRLYQALGDGCKLTNPRSWIYTVAINICRDHLRRKKKIRQAPNLQYEVSKNSNREQDLELKQDVAALQRALERLPERDRVLVMLYLDDLSYNDMAQVTGIKFSSIGKTLSRAIAKLAQLSREGEKP